MELRIIDRHETDSSWQFNVAVADKPFKVDIDKGMYQELTGGDSTPEELLEASFRFLLDREPVTSILSSFNISIIPGYFAEYKDTIGNYLK